MKCFTRYLVYKHENLKKLHELNKQKVQHWFGFHFTFRPAGTAALPLTLCFQFFQGGSYFLEHFHVLLTSNLTHCLD